MRTNTRTTPVLVMLTLCAVLGIPAASANAAAGFDAEEQPKKPVVITDAKELAEHAGKVVTIRTHLQWGKVPTVLGVMIQGDVSRELAGKKVEVTGKLTKFIHKADPNSPTQLPSGTYYNISDPGDGDKLTVKVVE